VKIVDFDDAVTDREAVNVKLDVLDLNDFNSPTYVPSSISLLDESDRIHLSMVVPSGVVAFVDGGWRAEVYRHSWCRRERPKVGRFQTRLHKFRSWDATDLLRPRDW
jgi:hypothetical protein